MNLLGLHHAGILVADPDGIDRALVEVLGLRRDHLERYGDELEIAFYPCGDTLVEVITPTREGWNTEWLERSGPTIQHLAFEVADIAGAVTELRERGVPLLEPSPRPGAGGTTIAFLNPVSCGGILLELVEDPASCRKRVASANRPAEVAEQRAP